MRAVRTWATPVLAVLNVALVVSGVLDLRSAVVLVVVLELLLLLSTAGTALAGLRAFRGLRDGGAAPWPAFVAVVRDGLPRPVAAVLVAEASTVRSLWLALRRRDAGVGPDDLVFGCAGGVGLTTGAVAVVATVEVVVVHLVVPWPAVRAGLLVVGVWGLLVVLGMWAGLRHHPHVVRERGLLLRAGALTSVEVPWHRLAAVRRVALHEPSWPGLVGRRLHLPVHGSTTLLAELHEPVAACLRSGGTAEVDSIAFSADDPAALLAAVRSGLRRRDVLLREDDRGGLPT